jgi:hypothetical protein
MDKPFTAPNVIVDCFLPLLACFYTICFYLKDFVCFVELDIETEGIVFNWVTINLVKVEV